MAERRPPGFNVDLGFYDSAEVLSIPRKLRAAAVGVWTLCGAYSANKLSDGHVPEEKLRDLGCTPAIRAALCATKPDPLWVDDEHMGGIRFTRWTKWQRTYAEVKAYREADAERKRLAREAKRNGQSRTNPETSTRTTNGHGANVHPDSRDPKTETETETETKRSTYPNTYEPSPERAPARQTGAEIARTRFSAIPARSIDAYRIAEAFSASLPVPIETGLLAGIGTQIDKCLHRGIPPPAIAAGLKAWTDSDSWSPTQIPNFVHKANNRSHNNGVGKPTEKAMGYDAALAELLQEVTTL